MEKTNPMRILDRAKVDYVVHEFQGDGSTATGLEIAVAQGEPPECVFKTLVTQGKSDRYYVFVVPVTGELDLKKAAAAVGEKSVRMVPSKDLLALTGYVHGGCSPLGMKKHLRTVVDSTAADHERFFVSGGKVGVQVELDWKDFASVAEFELADIRAPGERIAPWAARRW